MKRLNLCLAVLSVAFSLQLPALSQVLRLDLGNAELDPNESGQVRNFSIQNLGATPVGNIFGLNFALQISDDASGPRIESVSLYAGDSIFSSYSANQVNQGSSPWIAFFGIDSGGPALTLPGSSSSLVASVTFDTTGLTAANGPWPISARDVGPLGTDTEYVLIDSNPRPIDQFTAGTLSIIPEPAAYPAVMGGLMLGCIAWGRRRRKLSEHRALGGIRIRPIPADQNLAVLLHCHRRNASLVKAAEGPVDRPIRIESGETNIGDLAAVQFRVTRVAASEQDPRIGLQRQCRD